MNMVWYVTNLMVSHQPYYSGGTSHCNSGDIIVLLCRVILQDQVDKERLTLWMGANQCNPL